MRVVAVYNAKGGVGKTATTVNLAYEAARRGLRVLVWDLDPQGAATFTFRIEHRLRGGVKALTSKRAGIGDRIRGTDIDGIELLPSDPALRNVDLAFDAAKSRTKRLVKVVAELEGEGYDVVLVDCAPSSSLVSENVFAVADALVVPVVPTTLAVRTLDQLTTFLREGDVPAPPTWVVCSMVDGRKNLHAALVAKLQQERDDVLPVIVPAATEVELMSVHRAPVGAFAPSSPAGRAYAALWPEVWSRVES